jgi:dihydrofolate reductase
MRKVIYAYLVSVDGYVAGPDGSFDWGEPDPEVHQAFNDMERTLDTHLYGRNVWEVMTPYWPEAVDDPDAPPVERDYADAWNAVEHIVFSTTLTAGATLAGSVLAQGLVDEVNLFICPVIVGGGKSMFPSVDHLIGLTLAGSRVFDSGVVHLRYERAEEGTP